MSKFMSAMLVGPMYFSLDLHDPLTKLGRGYSAKETRPASARGNRSSYFVAVPAHFDSLS